METEEQPRSQEIGSQSVDFRLEVQMRLQYLTSVRRTVGELAEVVVRDGDLASRLALATHELLENALKYALDTSAPVTLKLWIESSHSASVTVSNVSNQSLYLFSAQYQQDPIPREGARVNVNWFNRFDAAIHMEFDRIIQSWDTASKPSEFSDFCVCTTWGQKGEKLYLLHVYRSRLLYPDLEKKVIALCDNWNASLVIIEDHDAIG